MVARQTSMSDRTAPNAIRRAVLLVALGLFVLGAALLAPQMPAQAQIQSEVISQSKDGFGRLVLNFDRLPGYAIRVTTGVLVISFEEPVQMDISDVIENLKGYVGAGRLDPDKSAVRFALAQSLTVNSMEAGDQLFIDLLPKNWEGLPPGLPEDVVAELARRAKEAEEKARRDALEALARENAASIEVQSGEYETFTRISFNWSQPFEAALERDGQQVSIAFNKFGSIDLEGLTTAKPRHLSEISSELTPDGLVLNLEIERGSAIRAFRDGRSYIVDLSQDSNGFVGLGSHDRNGDELVEIRLPGQGRKEPGLADLQGQDEPDVVSSYVPLNPQARAPTDYADWVSRIVDMSGGGDDASAVSSGKRGARMPGLSADDVDIEVDTASEVVVTTKRKARNVSIVFNFPQPVRAAVFQRGDTIWAVFDSEASIDISAIEEGLRDRLVWVKRTSAGATQYVRMKLRGPALTSVAGLNRLWTITIGDIVTKPTAPMELHRQLADNGRPQVVVQLKDAGPVHWLEDAELGDQLAVVTAFAPTRGMIKQQNFVEFTLFPSAHGLALKPVADDLIVTSQLDEIVISRRQGLWLSSGDQIPEVAARDVSGDIRPAFIDFYRFRDGGVGQFLKNRQKFERAVTEASEKDRTQVRLELVRFYLANLLASEASAVLNLIEKDDPAKAKEPTFNALCGISMVLLGRSDDAISYFSARGLAQGREVMLWRGVAEAMRANWRPAKEGIEKVEDLLWEYPDELRARFYSLAARASLEVSDLEAANHHLAVLEDIDAGKRYRAEAMLLRGQYLVEIGQSTAGLEVLEAAIDTNIRPVESRARFLKLSLMNEAGAIDQEELTSNLEQLSMSWRGSEFELQVLHRLSNLYAEQDKFRELFEVMKTASRLSYDSDLTRQIQDKIAVAFRELFMGDHADKLSPIEALSLFYDHRVLTPIGRQGDEMIRRLADRLIEVDLLDQAAELLNHQVENRLTGAARAQVAAQLALVHLMNRNPVAAIKALNRTQIAGIPQRINRQRNMLKARAMSDAGRMELALDILNTMSGEDVEEQKATTLWQARAWQQAAEQFEVVLGDLWKKDEPLTEVQRQNVMRAAISYSLADDRLGLDRLRTKFSQKMSEGPDAQAFQVVTNPIAREGDEFRELARRIAAIDTLEPFLNEFKAHQSESTERPLATPRG